MARHPGDPADADRPLPRRRRPQAHVGERVRGCSDFPVPAAVQADPDALLTCTRWTTKDIRFRIAAARRMLYREGCDSNVGGHVSARADDEDDAFWVTGFEYFDQTTPDRVAQARLRPRPDPVGDARDVARGELPRPDLRDRVRTSTRIVHLHSHYVSVLSSIEGGPSACTTSSSVLFHDEQATYFDDGAEVAPVGGRRARRQARRAHEEPRRDRRVSDSIEHATIEAMTLEQAARVPPRVRGGRRHRDPGATRSSAARRCTASTSCPRCGTANLERLRRSDPDLFAG